MKYSVLVKLHSKLAPKVVKNTTGELVVHINAKPHDGEANRELIKLLSKYLHVPKTQIRITKGVHSRQKVIEIDSE